MEKYKVKNTQVDKIYRCKSTHKLPMIVTGSFDDKENIIGPWKNVFYYVIII